MKTKKNLVKLVPIVVLIFLIPLLCTTSADILAAQTVDKNGADADEKALAEGQKILDKVAAALGGIEKIAKMKNNAISMKYLRVTDTDIMVFDAIGAVEYPDKMLVVVWNARGAFIMAVDGDKGWRRNPPGPLEQMNADFVASQLNGMKRDLYYILKNRDKYKIQLIGEKDYYDKKVIDLHITEPTDYHLYINPETYLPAGGSFKAMTSASPDPVLQEEFVYEYKNIAGINWSMRYVLRAFGSVYLGTIVNHLDVNLEFDKDFFKGTQEKIYEKIRDGKWPEN